MCLKIVRRVALSAFLGIRFFGWDVELLKPKPLKGQKQKHGEPPPWRVSGLFLQSAALLVLSWDGGRSGSYFSVDVVTRQGRAQMTGATTVT